MAIDDNTLYGVTGAQVKDLAERIKDGGVKVIYTDFELCRRINGNANLYYDRDYTQPVTGAELRAMHEKGPVALASKSWYGYIDDIFLLVNRTNDGDESDFFSYWIELSNVEGWELRVWDDDTYASAGFYEPDDTFTLTQTSQAPTPQTRGFHDTVLWQRSTPTNKYVYDFYMLKEYDRNNNTNDWRKIAFDTDIPTAVSTLTNDANYQNATQVSSAIAAAISGTTFWGQSVNNGAVNGSLIFEGDPLTTGTDISLENDGSLTIHTGSGNWVTFKKTNSPLDNEVNFNMAKIRDIADGTQDTDAVNVRQMRVNGNTAPSSSTVGRVGSLCGYVTNGTGHLAICTAINSGNPTTYTWQTLI